ncbi:hypothetical protein A3C21_01210 [Candidatus Kaiserbacteria bacterium RIFCSPHIGHO2_02_FULL_59_21]|uniref:Uncharacterized protein n=2 Tax=Candidatus Kaiseribacteriota TaxID=1752734 RepID=A0A0G1YUH3_9BACT|nr:MAG: hypothetical protein UY98_C0023G0003 [Candidatus Kaiserbacteria bacterium GW2011_GWA2_58_9]OGG63052.1 MAG: hypothetical protein A2766_01940 [Candidatus Kaiserbacteria bacterium RIFCSPHIGHO2_01_FULL_58_22]OGG67415.1 MAG: hypothetical protein A3C21_01210 [Candidatus Kaiserbacteria bacterium RIFCSPHIGHO2_02_FULL_59_21]OGG80264.1 MAG: hypothetical protein A2952_01845 [Candidatus Kaiserbacteria bacterium RIFCSPLOWO2_01_FULL_59_34]OGG85791.1 MAG: hypothetical protein A3I47_00125 [Candidatus K
MRRIEQIGKQHIGGGVEKSAVATDDHTARLLLHDRDLTDDQVHSLFLLQRLAYLLFPREVPYPKDWGRNKSEEPYVDVERIPIDAHHRDEQVKLGHVLPHSEPNAHEIEYYKKLKNSEAVKKARALLANKLANAGFKLEGKRENFSHAEGKVRFLDFTPAWTKWEDSSDPYLLHFEPEKLRKAIESIPDPERNREAMNRFNELMAIVPKKALENVEI